MIAIARQKIRANYKRICDVMRGLNYTTSRSTVANILKEVKIPIAPHRGMSWHEFLKMVLETFAACDMFTVDTPTGTYYGMFVIRIAGRKVQLAGITTNPNKKWVANQTRTLTDPFDGFLRGCPHLIHDREPSFRYGMDPVLRSSGIKPNCGLYWSNISHGKTMNDHNKALMANTSNGWMTSALARSDWPAMTQDLAGSFCPAGNITRPFLVYRRKALAFSNSIHY